MFWGLFAFILDDGLNRPWFYKIVSDTIYEAGFHLLLHTSKTLISRESGSTLVARLRTQSTFDSIKLSDT